MHDLDAVACSVSRKTLKHTVVVYRAQPSLLATQGRLQHLQTSAYYRGALSLAVEGLPSPQPIQLHDEGSLLLLQPQPQPMTEAAVDNGCSERGTASARALPMAPPIVLACNAGGCSQRGRCAGLPARGTHVRTLSF